MKTRSYTPRPDKSGRPLSRGDFHVKRKEPRQVHGEKFQMAFPEWFDEKFGPHTIELYQEEIRQTPSQIESLRKLFGPPARYPLLDLCCGWGRHALPLSGLGYRVVGLDGSRFFLDQLNRTKAGTGKQNPAPVRGDMRCLPFSAGSFSAAFQMYTSFGYGTDPQDDRRVLEELRRVLRDDGLYLLDLINWTLARRAFDGKYEETYPNFDVVEECRIDRGTDILRVKRALLYRDGRQPHIYSFEIRMFDQAGLLDLLSLAGFRVLDMWGDFDRSSYRPQSSYRMIAVCHKEAR